MMRWTLIGLALVSPFVFPWPLVALLALAAAFVSPLMPLAVGTLTDALYYSHTSAAVPWGIILGAIAVLITLGVRRFLETSIMR